MTPEEQLQLATLNRTILELKHFFERLIKTLSHFKSYHFGIETQYWRLWELDYFHFKSYHFGIETSLKELALGSRPL